MTAILGQKTPHDMTQVLPSPVSSARAAPRAASTSLAATVERAVAFWAHITWAGRLNLLNGFLAYIELVIELSLAPSPSPVQPYRPLSEASCENPALLDRLRLTRDLAPPRPGAPLRSGPRGTVTQASSLSAQAGTVTVISGCQYEYIRPGNL